MPREPQTGAGSLHLPKDIGVSESTAQTIENEWNTIGKVDAWLKAHGVHDNKEPDIVYQQVTVEGLLSVDMNTFTTLFATHMRWYNYASRLLADVRAHLLQVDNQMDDIKRDKRGHFRKFNEGKTKADRVTEDEVKDMIEGDPIFRALKLQQQELTQAKYKLESWAEGIESGLKTVSRQIENRKTESLGGNRAANMPGHAAGRWESRGMEPQR
jgi:hypothetical protein